MCIGMVFHEDVSVKACKKKWMTQSVCDNVPTEEKDIMCSQT
jgi:hypothetical protein